MEDKVKQVIVIRRDLKMSKGKEIAQACHASMVFLIREIENVTGYFGCGSSDCCGADPTLDFSKDEMEWISGSFTKIVVYVDSEQELFDINEAAEEAGITCHMIRDNGESEFGGVKTYTCLAVGPAKSSEIDPITGSLKTR